MNIDAFINKIFPKAPTCFGDDLDEGGIVKKTP